jgi:DNA-binding MarR family transcriptional regulator
VTASGATEALDYHALAEFRYQIRRFLRFSEDAARSVGLGPQQQQLLLAIKGLAPGTEPTVGELASRLQIRHHSAVELIDRLEQRQFVVRQHSGEDRRRVRIELTPQGEHVLETLSVLHRAELQAAAPALLAALKALLGS